MSRERIVGGDTLCIIIVLHQGSTLNFYLFTLAMNEVTRHAQDEVYGACDF